MTYLTPLILISIDKHCLEMINIDNQDAFIEKKRNLMIIKEL